MIPHYGKVLADRIFKSDPDAAIDTYGPPDYVPFSVIFSPNAKFTDSDMQRIGWLLRRLEYLDVAHTTLADAGLRRLVESETLKVVTVPFGTCRETLLSLLRIPSLHRINIPISSVLPAEYRELDLSIGWITDHISIYPNRKLDVRCLLPSHGVWYNLHNRSGR
ncbi:hypothetical protein [Roseiconus lacunae]|uniref:LysR substrate-binding domain-containing protein n=1 Tax=Roseiconus lacunae TaxID=2605694 RepID=A0ABT7PST9_9BACT|nr:hypothetical protein [Roseiconus lacunae]MCD0460150.1 hypothetical protein [Roseiconus lacunae]MDM4019547.1 hypothetical protein [Roseiconus lacunae]